MFEEGMALSRKSTSRENDQFRECIPLQSIDNIDFIVVDEDQKTPVLKLLNAFLPVDFTFGFGILYKFFHYAMTNRVIAARSYDYKAIPRELSSVEREINY